MPVLSPAEGSLLFERISSKVLSQNPLGDPVERQLAVLLPPHHDPATPCPALWVLSGFSGTGRGQLRDDDPWSESFPARVERLTAAGKLGPMIYVFPDCFTRLGGSQYLDSAATGAYETHLWNELLPWVESRWKISRRGLVGKSSGGYGALVQAMRHPELFDAVACHSGDMCFEYCYLPDFPKCLKVLNEKGGVGGFLQHFEAAANKRERPLFDAMNVLCMAACYSPDPSEPMGIALPFDLYSGRIKEQVWARWLAQDPLRMAPARADALRRLRLLFFDCGRRDEYALQWGARQLSQLLSGLGVPHVHQEFDDGHFATSYRYDVSLPMLWESLR